MLTDKERNQYTFFEAVKCTEDNFKIPEKINRDPDYDGKELFEEWGGYSIICPKKTNDIKMKGTQ